tara:strand:- start:1087 stop:1413 length:327 start_codon:yes stop_codon:yes gene_type:complete
MTDEEELKIIDLLKGGSTNAKIAFELIKGFGYTELEFVLMLWDKYKSMYKLSIYPSLFGDHDVKIKKTTITWIVRPYNLNNEWYKTIYDSDDKIPAFNSFIKKLKEYG